MSTSTAIAPAASGVPAARRRLGPGRSRRFGLALGPLLILLAWSAASLTGVTSERSLPAPWTVVETAIDLLESGVLIDHLLASLRRGYIALALGVALGWTLAVIAGIGRSGEYLIDGSVQVWRTIPDLALIPLFILWFGIGEDMKIFLVTLSIFTPIYISTYQGVRSVELRYVELAESVGLSRRQFIREVVLPGSLPGFYTGLRLASTWAMVALVVVEQVNSTTGLGYLLTSARRNGAVEVIFVGVLVYALIGFATYVAVVALERRTLRWKPSLGWNATP